MDTITKKNSVKKLIVSATFLTLAIPAWSVPFTVLSQNPGLQLQDITVDGTNMYFTAPDRYNRAYPVNSQTY